MKISTKGRYGLRAMVDLALHQGDHPVSLKEIAQRQGLSLGYLEHSFSALKKAGYIVGRAGSSGGYRLRVPADQLTAKMLLTVLEGDQNIVDPIPLEEETLLQRCIREQVWSPINQAVDQVISTTTLQDMARGCCGAEPKTFSPTP